MSKRLVAEYAAGRFVLQQAWPISPTALSARAADNPFLVMRPTWLIGIAVLVAMFASKLAPTKSS
ncbi:hypothetical protein [Pseudomonas nitroreducens]|uniref:hypothetical protein n=1 Tax=Pseudomonas nitroreducens TaxID=46680 RepID=UPI002659A24E|nr:hypothetical protein [Pseudomonas nitroreducens]MCP1648132.1 hypothetical protein [Pseudomonas nitroreducens]MCP1686707.1 hypothetical protein [Pseudomonas nitroreducens]